MSSYISDKLCIPLLYQVFKGISIFNICKNNGVYDILYGNSHVSLNNRDTIIVMRRYAISYLLKCHRVHLHEPG
jgi:hypothetical protein